MRRAALLVVAALLLAGCGTPLGGPGADDPAVTETPTETGTDVVHTERQDPDTDRLGWENGYWYDDPVTVNATDGLNESEREAVINRAMARVEYVRDLEFDEEVDISVISRSNYSAGGGGDRDASFQRFDNAKFEALFVIGNQEDSLQSQDDTRNQTVAGYYSPGRGDIVLISESDTPQMDGEATLAHELTHALQNQHFNLSSGDVSTRDAYNGRNGLIEGDARTVETDYTDRCGDTWACLSGASDSGSSDGSDDGDDGPSFNLGVYILDYFPYSDGPGFVSHLKGDGGWAAVNDAFSDPPATAKTVIEPDRYGSFEPQTVTIDSDPAGEWERVRPSGRADYAVLGQSAMTAMFAYTLYDDYDKRNAVVGPRDFLNYDGNSVNTTDPFNYGLDAVDGWAGDRMHVYHRGDDTGYVWRTAWESSDDAETFAATYRDLLRHWGGQQVDDGTWTVSDDSPFTDAFSLRVDGDTVTIVNAPSQSALDDIAP